MKKHLPGYFITMEGIDGSGKSTQIELLENHLIRKGYEVVTTRAPGGTDTAEALREFFLANHKKLSPRSEVAILLSSLNETWHRIVEPALDVGKIVISDRWYGSTLAYQGGGKGHDRSMINTMISAVLGDAYAPNLSMYVKVPYEVAQMRLSSRDPDKLSSLDKAGEYFFEKVIDTYDHFYPKVPQAFHGQAPNHYRIDGEDDPESVSEVIRDLVDDRLYAWEQNHVLARYQEELRFRRVVA
ncbi:MAG TPA: dTMP kinase [Dongiaceae bacterium]|nr:dTMP kinase [Dongiaceae bacterium]